MMKISGTILVVFISFGVFAAPPQEAGTASHVTPKQLENVGIKEHLGTNLPLDLKFTNEEGVEVPLQSFFQQGRPVLLTMVYYTCPSLCNFHLNGLSDVMKSTRAKLGQDYEFVAVSMNHNEKSDVAKKKKDNYAQSYGVAGFTKNAHFLVGSEENVKKLADTLGFEFKWDEGTQQYSHAAVAYIASPSGMLSRYLYGLEFSPETLRLSLVEASEGKIGSVIDQVVLFCFQFDPTKGKFTLHAFNLMRVGAGLMVVVLAVFLVPIWRKEKQRAALGA